MLIDGELILTESVAIVLYLAEKYADRGLLPLDLRRRAEVGRWLLFPSMELEQPAEALRSINVTASERDDLTVFALAFVCTARVDTTEVSPYSHK